MSTSPTTVKPPCPKRWIRYVSGLGYCHSPVTYALTTMTLRQFVDNEVEQANDFSRDLGTIYEASDVKARYVKRPPRAWLEAEFDRAQAAVFAALDYRVNVSRAMHGSDPLP